MSIRATLENNNTILSDESEVIKNLDKKYSRPGACLKGARLKEGLTQGELAKRIGMLKSAVLAMEHGKLPITKSVAELLSKVLHEDYKVFL